jgi:hydroxymethylpyrimidine pyrophosphatase-like HAD family hydrolase
MTTKQHNRKEKKDMYENTLFMKMVEARKARGLKPEALCADIDHSFWVRGMEAKMAALFEWLNVRHIPTALISGVDVPGIIRRIEAGELSKAQAIAGAVGTQLYFLNEKGVYEPDTRFEQQLIDLGFVRLELLKDAMMMVEELKVLHSEWRFDFQEPEREQAYLTKPDPTQTKFKISLYYSGDPSTTKKIVREVQARFPKLRVVTCEEINYNSRLKPGETPRKYCLDLLPVTKADVVKYLAEKFGLEQGVVAGDSGNDTDMLKNAPKGFVSALVGGAKPEAVAEIDAHAPKRGGKRNFRKATNGGIVYVEASDRIGPESIQHAFEVLERANKKSKK